MNNPNMFMPFPQGMPMMNNPGLPPQQNNPQPVIAPNMQNQHPPLLIQYSSVEEVAQKFDEFQALNPVDKRMIFKNLIR